MRLPSAQSSKPATQRAFTLVETLITAATLVIVMGSVIMCNLFGLAMAVRQQMWLGASDDSAQAISTLESDIRSTVSLQVGTFTNNTFVQTSSTGQQSGNALMIFTNSSTTTPYILYYYDSVSNNLVRSNYYGAGSVNDSKLVSANPITNDSTHPIFTEVDCTGTPITNSTPLAPSINIYLSFTKLQDPQILIQNGSAVDLYQIITTVSPRLRL